MEFKNVDSELFEDIKGRSKLIITFGGIMQGFGIPTYEFMNILNQFSVDKVFVKDLRQLWYQAGIIEAPSIIDLKRKLNKIILQGNYKEVFFIGNSMGGYAAIMFGVLLGVENIIVFSPQTFIDSQLRKKHNDYRWQNNIKKVHKMIFTKKITDLKPINHSFNNKNIQIEIHYSVNDFLDVIHAERLHNINGVVLHSYNFANHGLVKVLKEKKILQDILHSKLNDTS